MPNVFILGGCVSRDTRPFLGDDWVMVQYVARQGLISAAAGAASVTGESRLTSAFQNRCLERDINGVAFDLLREASQETDLVVIDLMVERLGVYRTPEGGYLTHTWELEESRLLEQQPQPLQHIAFGDPEHHELWRTAAARLVETLKELGLAALVLAPRWASKAEDGRAVSYRGRASATWNALYEPYVDELVALGLTVVRPPAEVTVASSEHQWGLAPYHYVDGMYEYLQRSIKEHYAGLTPLPAQPEGSAARIGDSGSQAASAT